MTERLHRVCVEKNSLLLGDLSYFLNWLDCSDLVIREHYRNQNCRRPDRFLQLVDLNDTILIDINIRDLKASCLQILACPWDCWVYSESAL